VLRVLHVLHVLHVFHVLVCRGENAGLGGRARMCFDVHSCARFQGWHVSR